MHPQQAVTMVEKKMPLVSFPAASLLTMHGITGGRRGGERGTFLTPVTGTHISMNPMHIIYTVVQTCWLPREFSSWLYRQ